MSTVTDKLKKENEKKQKQKPKRLTLDKPFNPVKY